MQIIHLDETTSTNNYATGRLQTNPLEEWTVILTFRQTQGRGQLSSHWESEDNSNLTFSIILRPGFLHAGDQFLLSQVIALGLADFLATETSNVRIKWPNDILIGKAKVAGILIEHSVMGHSIDWTVAGIGLNLNQKKFGKYTPEAISLSMAASKDYIPLDILNKVLKSIEKRYDNLKQGLIEKIRNDYLACLYRYNEWSTFNAGEEDFEAKITGTDSYGRLMLCDREGNQTAWPFKTIKLTGF